MRPARAKALIINAFALAGRFAIFNPYTQGAALGYVLLGLSARFVLTFDTHSFSQLFESESYRHIILYIYRLALLLAWFPRWHRLNHTHCLFVKHSIAC